jgi:uncharacterized cupin superfamily protein
MPRIHIPDLPWEEQHSPGRKFHSFGKNLSVALGGIRNGGPWCGGHPFDLQIRRIPAGAAVCPFHAHLAQWELFWVLAGTARVRAGTETHEITAGEVFLHPPGEPHQLSNPGPGDVILHPPGEAHQIRAATDSELTFLLVANNPPVDYWQYPDSNKWGLRAPRKFFRPAEVDYWDGEE